MDISRIGAFAGQLVSLAKAHSTPISTGAVILGIISAVVFGFVALIMLGIGISQLKSKDPVGLYTITDL